MESPLGAWDGPSGHGRKALFGAILCILDLFTEFLFLKNTRFYTFHDQKIISFFLIYVITFDSINLISQF